MDYESEEEDGGDGEDKEDQGEDEEEENAEEENKENNGLEESQPASAGVRVEKRSKRTKRGGEGEAIRMSQMRVNSVLDSNSAIERYCYDIEHELWCEVSLCLLHEQIKKILGDFS